MIPGIYRTLEARQIQSLNDGHVVLYRGLLLIVDTIDSMSWIGGIRLIYH